MKLIHLLLNNTRLRVRTKEVGPTFDINIGIPQGDGLIPVLFTTYLEASLREVRNNVHAQNIAYADDVDFISKDGVNLNKVEKILEKWNLKMNPTKTETLKIRSDNEWKNAKKTGHATRYKAIVEKAKAANNNGNAQAKKNMELDYNKKQKVKNLQSLCSKHHAFWL